MKSLRRSKNLSSITGSELLRACVNSPLRSALRNESRYQARAHRVTIIAPVFAGHFSEAVRALRRVTHKSSVRQWSFDFGLTRRDDQRASSGLSRFARPVLIYRVAQHRATISSDELKRGLSKPTRGKYIGKIQARRASQTTPFFPKRRVFLVRFALSPRPSVDLWDAVANCPRTRDRSARLIRCCVCK